MSGKPIGTRAGDIAPRLICNVNGKVNRIAVSEACKLFWNLNIGWVLRLGLFRYCWAGFEDIVHLSETRISAPALVFGRRLMEQRLGLVLASDFTKSQHDEYPPSKNMFCAWAARWRVHVFNAVPQDRRSTSIPFERVSIPEEPPFGYRIRPGVSRIVVIDVDDCSKQRGRAFDWSCFLEPPQDE
jgi:hypothetical protein